MNDQNNSASPATEHHHPQTREALRAAMLELVRAARHELEVVAPALDAAVWNSAAMGEALSHFIASHARNRVRIVVEDTEHMLSTCTRLVELARRFSDLLLVRRLGEAHHGLTTLFALADRESCLVQPDITMVDATFDRRAPRLAAAHRRRFEEIWDASEPVPGLHGFRL
jgi:hypothetical protein